MVKKKASLIPLDIRKEMINKEDKAKSICNQCELLSLARSFLYYTPMRTNDRDLRLMVKSWTGYTWKIRPEVK